MTNTKEIEHVISIPEKVGFRRIAYCRYIDMVNNKIYTTGYFHGWHNAYKNSYNGIVVIAIIESQDGSIHTYTTTENHFKFID